MYRENKATFGVRKSNFVGRVIDWMKMFFEPSLRACPVASIVLFFRLIRVAFCRKRTGSYDSDRRNTRITATADYLDKTVSMLRESVD